jgi:hypothetical protein
MQYLMLVRVDPEVAAANGPIDDVDPWVEEGTRRGLRIQGEPVEDPDTATTVRVRNGETLLSDGPFAEVKEIVAGYDLLEAPDLETVIDYAGRHPVAAIGAMEIRQVWDDFFAARESPSTSDKPGQDYLFLHVPQPDLIPTVDLEQADLLGWVRRVEDDGSSLGGARLKDADPATAATVRVRDGEVLVSRGPFAELSEEVAGIDLIRATDLDEAIALASAHPTSWIGAIEVRPFPV